MSTPVVGESPFLKRVLIPFWVVRIIIMLIEIVIYVLTVIVLSGMSNSRASAQYGVSNAVTALIAMAVVIMLITLACLILDIVCIVKRARHTLSPRFFLIVNVIQTTIWTILFILTMIGASTGATVAIGVIIYLSFVGMLIYASVVFHQFRKGTLRGTYAKTHQQPGQEMPFVQGSVYPVPHQAGYAPYGNVMPQHNAPVYAGAPYHHQQPHTSYDPQKPHEMDSNRYA